MANDLSIELLSGNADAEVCARIMATTTPWTTLGRTFEQCLALIVEPAKEVYVARRAGAIAGFVIIDLRGLLRGYIQILAVDEAHRGEGIGRALIAFAEERIHRESPNVFIAVSSFNHDAKRLYERLGFVAVGEFPDFLVTGHSEFLLRKTIGAWDEWRSRE